MTNFTGTMEKEEKSIAVLIDGDNISYKIADSLFTEMSKYGRVVVKRIYGDWSAATLKNWREILLEYSIVAVQQGRYTIGKNATDSRMIIDAMDLLYSDKYDAFCLVSSDSDFTSLASRIRESGLVVYGFGEKKTPKAFVKSCDKFIYFESVEEDKKIKPLGRKQLRSDTKLLKALRKGVDELSDDSGWVHIMKLSEYLSKNINDFDTRNYGYPKLTKILEVIDEFDFDYRGPESNPKASIYLKLKE